MQEEQPPPLPPTWTRKEVAKALQISERHLADLEKEHAVPVIRAGDAIRYDRAAFDHLTDACRAPEHRRGSAGHGSAAAADATASSQAALDLEIARARKLISAMKGVWSMMEMRGAPPLSPKSRRRLDSTERALETIRERNRAAMRSRPNGSTE